MCCDVMQELELILGTFHTPVSPYKESTSGNILSVRALKTLNTIHIIDQGSSQN